MKLVVRNCVLFLSFLGISGAAFAAGPTSADLVGQFSLSGNGGFLQFELSFHPDQSADLTQVTADGTKFECNGSYRVDQATFELTAVYHCPADEVMVQKLPLAGVTDADLLKGIELQVRIQSSLGTDTVAPLTFQRK